MKKIVHNLLGMLVLAGAWLIEVYVTKRHQAPGETPYSAAWCVWIGGPIVFGLINRDAFEGVAMQLRIALVLFLAALLTVLVYVLFSPGIHSFLVWLQAK